MALTLEESGPPVELHAGDFALLLYRAAHTVCSKPARHCPVAYTCERWPAAEEPAVLRLGSEVDSPRILSGNIQLTRTLRSAPVNRALPHILHFSAANASPGAGSAMFSDMAPIEAACRNSGASAFVYTLAQLYLVQSLRQVHSDLRQVFPTRIGSPDMGRMAVVVRKIRAHLEKRWTVASLTQDVGCSRSSFAAKFQAYAGKGPIKFVSRIRLSHATAMLESNPDLPLWEVAKRVGYTDQGSFTRAFKVQFGVAPRHYVAHLLQGGGEDQFQNEDRANVAHNHTFSTDRTKHDRQKQ